MFHKPFIFRHFKVAQDLSVMKVGADSMILGASVIPGDEKRILDIGTGTGVLALMLAQRSNAIIDAIDSDQLAYMQAKQNFENSSWGYRMNAYHSSLQDFEPSGLYKYDLIISNPPYFEPNHKASQESAKYRERREARSFDNLDFYDLLSHSARLLSEPGKLYVIIPAPVHQIFVDKAEKCGLFPFYQSCIYSKETSPPVRYILGLQKQKSAYEENRLVIYENDGSYTREYIELTKDFHAIELGERKK